MGCDPNKGREGSKNGSRGGDAKLNCVFSTSPACLCLSVAYRYLRKEKISHFEIEISNLLPKVNHTISIFFNMIFASWVAGRPPNTDLGRPYKSLGAAALTECAAPQYSIHPF